ncbi:hypothetical protein [Desulfurococcus amylolyticus]|uniref:Uncharacterized protein n=1 Tax=Desulfurococcus amylolyticus DSM 16532 TaxID=768672 RepID=I3XRX8_DESAM|nr:hypothetical protein [Desulfurococcus amylolyticus]AFL66702.1 hypothetical protein Desfe_0811 [Desulfurococcus amylolyticus DSM 16532]
MKRLLGRLIDKVVDYYRGWTVFLDEGLEEYLEAPWKLKSAIAVTLGGVLVILLTLASQSQGTLILTVVPLLIIAAWLPVLDKLAEARENHGLVNKELAFFIVMASASCRTGLEPLELLRYVSESRVFKGFRVIGEKFTCLEKIIGVGDALQIVSSVLKGRAGAFFIEYSTALSTGIVVEYLMRSAGEAVKDAWSELSRIVERRSELGVLIAVVASVIPALTVGFTILMDAYILYYTLIPILALGVVGSAIIPNYPLPFKVLIEKSAGKALSLMYIAGVVLLTYPLTYMVLTDSMMEKTILLYLGAASMILGTPGFTLILGALLKTFELRDVLEDVSVNVRTYRSLIFVDDEPLSHLGSKPIRTWLIDYVYETLRFHRLLGEVEPDVYTLFMVFTNDLLRALRLYLAGLTIMITAMLSTPFLVKTLLTIAPFTSITLQVAYSSILATGFLSSKLILGRNISTLVPGLLVFIYGLL